jgi:hypothetical protein
VLDRGLYRLRSDTAAAPGQAATSLLQVRTPPTTLVLRLTQVCTSQYHNSSTPEAYRLDFSLYQSGVDFECPYSNRP